MSILIKGMEMPKCCGACKLSAQVSMSLGAVMRCRLLGVVGTSASDPHDVLNKRHPNCPLVELPDKHGVCLDVISRQAALEHLKKRLYESALNNDGIASKIFEEIADNRVQIWVDELPPASTVTDSDTISRQATINAIQNHFNPTGAELSPELASVLAGVGVVINMMPPSPSIKPDADTNLMDIR